MEKLRPCPFCGSDLVTLIERKPRMYPWVVMCHDCGAEAAVDLGQSGAIEAWNKRSLEDDLLAAAKKALEFLTHAQFDFSNGNTDSTGTIDEGNVYGWQAHHQEVENLLAAISKAEGKKDNG